MDIKIVIIIVLICLNSLIMKTWHDFVHVVKTVSPELFKQYWGNDKNYFLSKDLYVGIQILIGEFDYSTKSYELKPYVRKIQLSYYIEFFLVFVFFYF